MVTFYVFTFRAQQGLKTNLVSTAQRLLRTQAQTSTKTVSFSSKLVAKLCLGSGLFVGKHLFLTKSIARCEESHSRIADEKLETVELVKFDLKKFWELVKPHSWYLIIAISVYTSLLL